jgi:hypothetical protein
LNELQARRVSVTALNGRMIATVLTGIAEFERELIQERIRSGIAAPRRAAKGSAASPAAAEIRSPRAGRSCAAMSGLSHEVLPDPEAIDVKLRGLHRVAIGRVIPGLVSVYLLAVVQKRAAAMGDRGNPLTWLALGCLNGEAFVQHRGFLHPGLSHPSADRIGMGDRRLTLLQPSHRTKRNS